VEDAILATVGICGYHQGNNNASIRIGVDSVFPGVSCGSDVLKCHYTNDFGCASILFSSPGYHELRMVENRTWGTARWQQQYGNYSSLQAILRG
jgi:hypothetical protein